MKRDFPHAARRDIGVAASCIALVDQRYLAWLLGHTAENPQVINRPALPSVLASLLDQAGIGADIQRIYWYANSVDDSFPPAQIHRKVPEQAEDGGLAVREAIGADLKRLSERQACKHILIASDDHRLVSLIDEAQLYGISVHILADDTARNLEQLRQDDPDWADLLAQADHRLIMTEFAMRELGPRVFAPRQAAQRNQLTAEDMEAIRPLMQKELEAWWSEEPEDLREDLREELQVSRGIPQEVDRHLLLRIRKTLDRTLSFHEKKLMRDMVRNIVLGEEAPTPETELVQ
jgi:hypothetical protein